MRTRGAKILKVHNFPLLECSTFKLIFSEYLKVSSGGSRQPVVSKNKLLISFMPRKKSSRKKYILKTSGQF